MSIDISPLWIVIGLVLFVLGVRRAISEAARRNYEQTKAAVPVLHAAARGTFWAMARTAGLVLVLLVSLTWFDLLDRNVDVGGLLSRLTPSSAEDRRVEDGRAKNGNVICFTAECRRQNPERR